MPRTNRRHAVSLLLLLASLVACDEKKEASDAKPKETIQQCLQKCTTEDCLKSCKARFGIK